MKPGKTGLTRIINATAYSLRGFRFAWKNEAAFRQEIVLCLILIPLAFWLGPTAVETALLIGSCLIVLMTELLNSSIESAVDRVGDEYHHLAGSAKDLGSAAVMVSLILAGTIWTAVLIGRFF